MGNLINAKDFKSSNIPNKPGIYKWYVNKGQLKKLLGIHVESLKPKLSKDDSGEMYYIYVGEAKKLKKRLGTHIEGKCRTHISVDLENGKLSAGHGSTLRRSIGSLLWESFSEEEISEFIAEMYVEAVELDYVKAREQEKKEMTDHILPLNIKDNHRQECKDFVKELSSKRVNAEKKFIDTELRKLTAVKDGDVK